MFETGCFIHSHPIAYIFNSSPRERESEREEEKEGRERVKAKELQEE